jgi:hypothetical protein
MYFLHVQGIHNIFVNSRLRQKYFLQPSLKENYVHYNYFFIIKIILINNISILFYFSEMIKTLTLHNNNTIPRHNGVGPTH